MTFVLATRLVVASAAIVLAAGCGGGSGGGAPAGAASAPASGTPTASAGGAGSARKNACDFVDRGQMEAILGTPVTLLHDIQADDETACEVNDAKDSKVPLVTVTVLWKGGKDQADAEKAGLALAKSLMNEKDADIEALTGSGGVAGIADAAYYSDVMPSWLLKGDVLIKVIAPTSPGAQTKRVFLSVAKTAVSKL
jgi:hypothetical protein